ncbi:MAG: gliding motility-associated C-terminal domain-containing protein [Bacteroidota bacterium]
MEITNQYGCVDSAEVVVLQDTVPPGADAGEPATLNCQQTSLELAGNASDPLANVSFDWTTTDGNIVSAQNTSEPVVNAAGTYFLTVTDLDNGCTSTDSVTIQAVTLDSFFFEIVQPTCPLPTGEIAFSSVAGGTPGYVYSIDGGITFSDNLVFSDLEPAVYELVVQDADGCELSETVQILPPPAVEISFTEPVLTVNFGEQIQLDPQLNVPPTSLTEITWTPFATGELSCDDCLRPILTPNLSGEFTLFVSDVNGCSDSASFVLEVVRSLEFFVPNAFSPNGDGFNDVLMIFAQEGLATEVVSFQIFNRWGGAVFAQRNFPVNVQSYGWDGKQAGKDCDVGVYVWFAEVELTDGERVILKGGVTLVR